MAEITNLVPFPQPDATPCDDFAYRAREAGWTEEEVAYYLGYVTAEGTLSLRSTARFTQLTRAQVKEKLKILRG